MNTFSMIKRVVSRLEKYVFDRVWNEPYTEYRTNTRPRILNRTTEASLGSDVSGNELTGTVYEPASGVLSNNAEQIALPSSDAYYVYAIERTQFRPIKLNATDWVSLQSYSNKNLTDLQVISDEGVFLWRGGIYIKQDPSADGYLLAINAEMFHRCTDTFTTENNERVVSKSADPTAIFFVKYVDSDGTADNAVECSRLTAKEISDIKNYRTNPLPSDATVAFYNGRVVSGDPLNYLEVGGYVEYVKDADVLTDLYLNRSEAPIYTNADNKQRVLIHIPCAVNPDNYLITYNTCDVYLVPKVVTAETTAGYHFAEVNGTVVHLCDREANFHQLTHNDFSIDLDLLDSIAAKNGYDGTSYVIHVVVRHHEKKLGLIRDANYCDLLYIYSHTDDDIIKFLTNDASKSGYNLSFWTASHLEANGVYAKVMIERVGSKAGEDDKPSYYRATIDRTFRKPTEKQYFNLASELLQNEVIPPQGSPLTGVIDCHTSSNYLTKNVTEGAKVPDGTMECVTRSGVTIEPRNQCTYCKIRSFCTNKEKQLNGTEVTGTIKTSVCPNYSPRGIEDYIKIFGYYTMLSLICKRVTTYLVMDEKRTRIVSFDANQEIHDYPNAHVHEQSFAHMIPVRVPTALFDLKYNEWYPLVYINGVKAEDAQVTITGDSYDAVYGLEEMHWTYSPSFGDEIFWDTDTRHLKIVLSDEVELKVGDYVTVELVPKPEGSTDAMKLASTGHFKIDAYEDKLDATIPQMAFEPLGSNLKINGTTPITNTSSLLNSELMYMNGLQLVAGIDYKAFPSKGEATFTPTVQNVSYLSDEEANDNLIEAILTSDKIIGSAKGFIIGNEIEWDGASPFWFDNLSILSVGGKVVSSFTYQYSCLQVNDGLHVNGEPYYIRTSVPTSVLTMLGNETYAESDVSRMKIIRDYFNLIVEHAPYRAIIPYSHKVYSTYLLAIIKAMVDGYMKEATEFTTKFAPLMELDTGVSGSQFTAQNKTVTLSLARCSLNKSSPTTMTTLESARLCIWMTYFTGDVSEDSITAVKLVNSSTSAEKALTITTKHKKQSGDLVVVTSPTDIRQYDTVVISLNESNARISYLEVDAEDAASVIQESDYWFTRTHSKDSYFRDKWNGLNTSSYDRGGGMYAKLLISDFGNSELISRFSSFTAYGVKGSTKTQIPSTTKRDGDIVTCETTQKVTKEEYDSIRIEFNYTGELSESVFMAMYSTTAGANAQNGTFYAWEELESEITGVPISTESVFEHLDFKMYKDPKMFKAQFAQFEHLKQNDVVYTDVTVNDLRFMDIYPVYHNFDIGSRELKRKIEYMFEMLSPEDEIRHREHINVN